MSRSHAALALLLVVCGSEASAGADPIRTAPLVNLRVRDRSRIGSDRETLQKARGAVERIVRAWQPGAEAELRVSRSDALVLGQVEPLVRAKMLARAFDRRRVAEGRSSGKGVFSVLDPRWRPAYGDRKAFQRLASQIGVGLGYRDDYGPLVDRVLRWNTVERAGRRPGDLLLRTYP